MSTTPDIAIAVPLQLRWSDQDLLGHVNNAKLMTLLEEARIRALHVLQDRVQWTGPFDLVVRTAHTDFLLPVLYTDQLVVNVWVSRIGNSSFVLQHELVQGGNVCVTLEAVMVAFDAEQQRAATIPDPIRTALQSVLHES